MRAFLGELRKRRVYRAAIAYILGASALIQVTGTVLPTFHVADWIQQFLLVLLALGFPVALVLAFIFEWEEGEIRVTAGHGTGGARATRRRIWILAVVGLLFAGSVAGTYWRWRPAAGAESRETMVTVTPTGPIPEKSIAVLPFANLSDEQQSAFFTDGVHDEVLNDLAKIADLKVISRTSVMQYGSGGARNVREIGLQLGVAHVLEGSVRRAGNRVRVTAQLIDARSDRQLWAEQYDRDLEDVFAIQSEIASAIVAQLHARLSPQEKAGIDERPTRDLAAYDLYLQAKDNVNNYLNADDQRAGLLQAVRMSEEAVARDPEFALAYCYAARAHSLLYFLDLDPTASRRTLAENAIQQASRLRPDSPEVHLARADFQFHCRRDYLSAKKEIEIARPNLPNSSPLLVLSAYLDRRLGHWREGEEGFRNAIRLDPRNANAVNLLSDTYVLLRDFAEATAVYDRAEAAGFYTPIFTVRKAAVEFGATGKTEAIQAALDALPELDVGGGETAIRVMLAMIRRDAAAAREVLAASSRADFQEVDFTFYYPRAWYEAIIARLEGDGARARVAFAAAREIIHARLRLKPEDARTLAVLAQIDAGLGRREEAVGEAQHAAELMPMSADAYDAPLVRQGLAQVYTWTGEPEAAIDILQELVTVPGYLTYGFLRVDPAWDPLRGHPRFEQLLASMATR
ncbi:MAG: hypothetical protein ABI883_02405 [Chthoniobacterales bacterium]